MPIEIIKWQCSICGKIHDNREIACRDCEESHPKIKKTIPVFEPGMPFPISIRIEYEDGTVQKFRDGIFLNRAEK